MKVLKLLSQIYKGAKEKNRLKIKRDKENFTQAKQKLENK